MYEDMRRRRILGEGKMIGEGGYAKYHVYGNEDWEKETEKISRA